MNSSNKGPSNKKKGRSKKAHVLAASVESATQNFLEKGEKIAKESQFLKEELTAAVEDVRKQGTFLLPRVDGYKKSSSLVKMFLNTALFTSLHCFLLVKSDTGLWQVCEIDSLLSDSSSVLYALFFQFTFA